MINKINSYVFIQILKSCTLIFFIFLSISWLLQLTRLFTLTNLVQIDILNVFYLSIFIIPNLLTIIIPFILIFGILLCFIKLHKDKEIIAIFSLGMQLKPIKYPIILFSLILVIFYMSLNFFISPKIYEVYKLKEFELRNTINFDKMILSNFIKLNENTTIDFKKNKNSYEDIFISFSDEKENYIFAEEGVIINQQNKYIFQLNNGFKISLNQENEIEKLEFKNYLLKIDNDKSIKFNNYDRNTLTILDDFENKDYLNISYKFVDIVFALIIIYFFYYNNIVNFNFTLNNNIIFISISIFILIINQLLKNSETDLYFYYLVNTCIIFAVLILSKFRKRYE